MQFKGKVALITGAGNGIGRAAALVFAARGAAVVAVDLDAAAAERTVATIKQQGGTALYRSTAPPGTPTRLTFPSQGMVGRRRVGE